MLLILKLYANRFSPLTKWRVKAGQIDVYINFEASCSECLSSFWVSIISDGESAMLL